jgi:hypothetical protein
MSNRANQALRIAALCAAALAWQGAWAEDVTIVGPVTKIELAADGASAVATMKDGKSGEDVKVNITDDLTLDKFKDKRIVEGDEIRARIDKKDGRNASKSFKKTAGC